MRTSKKIVSLVLAVMMVVSMMSVMAVSVSAAGAVAEIDGTPYETLEAAFNAAQDGETITVLANSSGNGIKVAQGKYATTGLTVDFGGYTYTVDGTLVGSTGTETNGFQLLKNNTITFKNGTIYSEKAKFLVQNYSNLTLDNMTLTLNNPSYAYAYTLSNNNGNIVIDDTTINANPAGGFAFDVCRYSSYPSVSVTVTGDSVINGDVELSASKGDAKDGMSLSIESGSFIGDIVVDSSAETAMANSEDSGIEVSGGSFTSDVSAYTTEGATVTSIAAAITKADGTITTYTSGVAAYSALADGDTLKLYKNAYFNGTVPTPAGATVTIDLNGYNTASLNNYAFYVRSGSTLNFVNTSSTDGYVFTNAAGYYAIYNRGTTTIGDNVIVQGNVTQSGGVYNNAGSSVTVDGGTVIGRGESYAGIVVWGNSSVTVEDGLVKGVDTFAISGNGSSGNGGYDITINGGTVTSNVTAIYHPNDGTLTITDGTITGATAVAVKSGTTNISGGTLIANGEAQTFTHNGNGTSETGDALFIEACNYPGGTPTVSVTGGTFTSANGSAVATYAQNDTYDDEKPTNFVENGTFSSYLDDSLVATGFEAKSNGDGTYSIAEDDGEDDDFEIIGYQKKVSESAVRFITKINASDINDATEYGYVVASVSDKTQDGITNWGMLALGNGGKKIDCTGSYNTISGYGEGYVTLKVTGMEASNQVVARFYYVKNGVTYYAKYATYDGILATY